jgi:hypothetical protein
MALRLTDEGRQQYYDLAIQISNEEVKSPSGAAAMLRNLVKYTKE